jgi:hypothetical protein
MTVLLKCSILLRVFSWPKGLNVDGIHKEMSPVYGGKCLSHESVHNSVEKSGKSFAGHEEVETEVAEITAKYFDAASFDAHV